MIREKSKKIGNGIEKKLDILKNLANDNYVYLSFGTNLNSIFGSKKNNLEIAQLLLIKEKIDIISRSNYYETFAYPNKKDPKFINCIVKVKTNYTPKKLIKIIFKIEKFIGRVRNNKNEPRVCDIDIIDYKSQIIEEKNKYNLIIPHKLAHTRTFVLIPLMQINPKWIHPKLKVNINFLVKNLQLLNSNYIKKIKNE